METDAEAGRARRDKDSLDHVNDLDLTQRPFRVTCDSGDSTCRDRVLATGAQARWLDLRPREVQGLRRVRLRHLRRLFYKNKEVLVIRRAATPRSGALFLTNFASKVTVVHRRNEIPREKILQERLFSTRRSRVIWDSALEDVRATRIRSGSAR